MQPLAIIPALLLAAVPTPTKPDVDPSFGVEVGEPTSIRSCVLKVGGPFIGVCYNRVVTSRASILSVPVSPWKRVVERVERLDCSRRIPYAFGSVRNQVAKEYCPQVRAGTLPPAPFLF